MQKVEDWLKIDYMVKEAKVSRQLPATLKITITERTSFAIIATGRSFAIVDEQGMVIRRLREISEADLIYISGVDGVQGGLMPGEKLDNEQMITAIEVIQQIPQLVAENSGIGELDVQDPQKIKLYTKGGVEIRIGSSANFDEKQIVYTNIINDLEKNKKLDNIRYIDVSLPDRPVYFFDN
jgi:cell division protein FtsQ